VRRQEEKETLQHTPLRGRLAAKKKVNSGKSEGRAAFHVPLIEGPRDRERKKKKEGRRTDSPGTTVRKKYTGGKEKLACFPTAAATKKKREKKRDSHELTMEQSKMGRGEEQGVVKETGTCSMHESCEREEKKSGTTVENVSRYTALHDAQRKEVVKASRVLLRLVNRKKERPVAARLLPKKGKTHHPHKTV